MDEDLLRTLLARTEGEDLEFKTEFHVDAVELTKDVMAMANVLRRNRRGYFIFGVDEDPETRTGVAVGLSVHPEDHNLRQMMAQKLNRMPVIEYLRFEVEAHQIGVLSLLGVGARPYYPLKDFRGMVQRFVSLKRNGSTTEVASPDEINVWHDEDRSMLSELQKLQLEELQSRRLPIARITALTGAKTDGVVSREFSLTNLGSVELTRFGGHPRSEEWA